MCGPLDMSDVTSCALEPEIWPRVANELVARDQGNIRPERSMGVHSAWGTLGDSVHTPTLLLNLMALPLKKGSPSPPEKRK